jgi:acyl-coenzyme A thioesterase PaaI-like protein
MEDRNLQDRYAALTTCFGCGPANTDGLRLKSVVRGDEVVAEWQPLARHEAFPGIVNGGIIGTLLDCHSNWTAAWQLMVRAGVDRPPPTVTADLSVRFERPTPSGRPVTLRAHVIESDDRRATVEAELEADGRRCATSRATFVAVTEGHPAFRRW